MVRYFRSAKMFNILFSHSLCYQKLIWIHQSLRKLMLFPTYNVRRQAFTVFFWYFGFFLPYVKGRQFKYEQPSTALKKEQQQSPVRYRIKYLCVKQYDLKCTESIHLSRLPSRKLHSFFQNSTPKVKTPFSRLFENYGNYKISSDSVKEQAMNSPLISTSLYM